MWKIKCECGRWVMRVQQGGVYAICKRCGAEVRVEISALIADLERELATLRGMQGEMELLVPDRNGAVTVQRKLALGDDDEGGMPKMFG